jgi:TrmH family RNA methyltransferase
MLLTLKEHGFRILAADMGGKVWNPSTAASEKLAVVLGNEGNGLTEETARLADEIVRIPINDKNVESLNVAATGAICMYLSKSDSMG